jgi:selenide,water dikinase
MVEINPLCICVSPDSKEKMIAMDAQTSGGLLMCVPQEISENVLSELHKAGQAQSAVIGKVTEKREKYLYLES